MSWSISLPDRFLSSCVLVEELLFRDVYYLKDGLWARTWRGDNCVCCACLQLFMAPFAFKTTDGFFCFLPFDKDIEGRAEWEERREKEDLPSSLCHFQFGIKDLFNRAQELHKSFILLALFFSLSLPILFLFLSIPNSYTRATLNHTLGDTCIISRPLRPLSFLLFLFG